MDWTEISVTVDSAKTDEAAAIANMVVPYGIYIEDYSCLEADALEITHDVFIEQELLEKDRTKSIIHMYIAKEENAREAVAYLAERFNAVGIEHEILSCFVDDADWNENWKKYFKAFTVGERLAVCPSWEEFDNAENRTVISLDPAAAFGTGAHATTSMCLSVLERKVTPETRVLDIGTGSGILAIAAALLGAEKGVGVDIDEQSVKTAKENAERNNVSENIEFFVGDLADKVSGKYDIVCANIVADVIMRLFQNVGLFMEDNAILIISGIIDMRSSEVEESALTHGFKIIESHEKEEWRAYVLTK